MFHIAANIKSIKEYLSYILQHGHKALRPTRCPSCGKTDLWCHGSYQRKSDRKNKGAYSLNPINIFRFFCPFCKCTCSVLPEFISPRRWYIWNIQQAAFLLAIAGHSWRYIAKDLSIARSTPSRWFHRFEEMFKIHAFHLSSRFFELGANTESVTAYWKACLQKISLARAMYWVYRAGGAIP
jgi:transposase